MFGISESCKFRLNVLESLKENTFCDDRICEICGATAENIVGNENSNFMEQWNDADADAENRTEPHARCWQSLSLCNFFLACMVVTFILLWLFRVTIS